MSNADGETANESTWAVHFPGNLRWSNAMQIVKGMVPYAAVAHGRGRSRRRSGSRRAPAKPISTAPGARNGPRMADRVAGVADDAAAQRRQITAGNHYMRAGNYYYSAERFIPPGPEKMAMYRKALRCYQAAMERLHPEHRAGRGARTRARACRPISSKAPGSGRRPTVVLFDGMDNAKEMSVIFAGLDFAKRGINTLAIDGPGQAETLRLRQHPQPSRLRGGGHRRLRLRRRTPRGRSQARRRHGLQLRRLPRAAHRRFREALRRLRRVRRHALEHLRMASPATRRGSQPIRARASTSIFQFRWVVGAPDNETALEWAKKFTLEGVAQTDRMRRSWCCTARTTASCRSPRRRSSTNGSARSDKHIKIFTDEEGGAEHCQVDHRQLGIDYIGDWLLENM